MQQKKKILLSYGKEKKKTMEFGAEALFLISGPCVIEEEGVMMKTAEALKKIEQDFHLPIVFKSSYQKDNRSSLSNYVGPGLKKGLAILKKIKEEFGFPLLSDIHSPDQAEPAAEVLDILQIPAYLCMQSSLLVAAAKTGRIVNIKHGQFLSPQNMAYPLKKCLESGNDQIILTERGYTFGYNDLVVDPRSFYELNQLGYPVVFDVTHAIRKYGVPSKDKAGGARQYLPVLARAGVAAGVDGVFVEAHPKPNEALCDAASQLDLRDLPQMAQLFLDFHRVEIQHRSMQNHL